MKDQSETVTPVTLMVGAKRHTVRGKPYGAFMRISRRYGIYKGHPTPHEAQFVGTYSDKTAKRSHILVTLDAHKTLNLPMMQEHYGKTPDGHVIRWKETCRLKVDSSIQVYVRKGKIAERLAKTENHSARVYDIQGPELFQMLTLDFTL